ncbi:MAG: response regulator [Saprospiraceae bacterium]|nr:response regulator [Saprospiraceae bacterium]
MRSLTVLLAEDEPIISLHIQYLLEEKGLHVVQVSEHHDIFQACALFQPDFAILNFNQQDSAEGMALARALKNRFLLPVMIISGACPQDIAASKDFDSSLEILYKPFTSIQLKQLLNRHKCIA